MKHRNVWVKVMLPVFCLVFVFSTLVGCTSDKLDELQNKVDELGNQTETIGTQANELETALKQVQAIADAAATTAKLEEVITRLNAVKDTADAAATAEALVTAKQELKDLIAAKADDEATAVKLSEIKETLEKAATAEALTAAQDALKELIQKKADSTETTQTLTDILTQLNAVKDTADAAATAAALEAAQAELKQAIAAKADASAVQNALDRISALESSYVTSDAMETAIENLRTTVDEWKSNLQTEISTVKSTLDSLKTDVTSNQTEIASLQTRLTALETSIHTDNFAQQYQKATEMLAGDGEYSLKAFEALVASVEEKDYSEDTYEKFLNEADRYRFFLNRALSEQDIKDLFYKVETNESGEEVKSGIRAVIAALPTLTQTLDELVQKYETGEVKISNQEDSIKKLTDIRAKIIGDLTAENDLANRYDTVVNAHTNLMNASKTETVQPVIDAIGNIPATIVYLDSKDLIDAADSAFAAYQAAYFSNESYTALYAQDMTAAELITNSDALGSAHERYAQLTEAVKNQITVLDVALCFETARPLWSDSAALSENSDDLEQWIEAYEIDEANLNKIYGEKYTLLEKAVAYANAMNEIYNGQNIAQLVADVQTLCDKEMVLYTDYEASRTYRTQLDALKNAIAAVENYDETLDSNFATMIGQSLYDDFTGRVEPRMAELDEANTKVSEIIAEMQAIIDKPVAFSDSKAIFGNEATGEKGFETRLKDICTEYEIETDDANYVAIVEPALDKFNELKSNYEDMTSEIADLYLKVEELLTTSKELAKGNTVIDIQKQMNLLVTEYHIDTTDLELTLVIRSDDPEVPDEIRSTNLKTLYKDWIEWYNEFRTMAEEAQTAAEPVTAKITSLDETRFADVKYFATIEEAWNAFAAWAQTYLEIDVNSVEEGVTAEAVAAVQEIHRLNNKPDYVFVTSENYAFLQEAYQAAKEHLAAAREEAGELLAEMNAAIEDYRNIHRDFESVATRYNTYVTTYFAGAIDADSDLMDEFTVHETFVTKKGEHDTLLEEAKAAAQTIKDKIGALVEPTQENVDTVLAQVAEINALVAAYKEAYNCDIIFHADEPTYEITVCESCGISVDEAFKFYKIEKWAAFEKAYKDAFDSVSDEALKTKLYSALDLAEDSMRNTSDLLSVMSAYSAAMDNLNDILNPVTP